MSKRRQPSDASTTATGQRLDLYARPQDVVVAEISLIIVTATKPAAGRIRMHRIVYEFPRTLFLGIPLNRERKTSVGTVGRAASIAAPSPGKRSRLALSCRQVKGDFARLIIFVGF